MYNRIADYGLRTGFKGELKSGNHIFLVLVSFLFSASLKCIKSSFGSCFCLFIVLFFLRNKRSANSANIKSCFISAKQVDF